MNPNQGREAAYVTSRVKDLSLITNTPDYVGLFACITPKANSSLEEPENVVYLDANGDPTDDHSEDNKVYLPQLVRDVDTLTELFGDPRVDPKTYRDFYIARYIVQNGFACYIAKIKSGKPYEASITSSTLFDYYNGNHIYNTQLDNPDLSQLFSDISDCQLFTAKSSIVGENTLSLKLVPLKPYSINQVVLEITFKNRATSTSEEVEIASTRISLSPDTKNADLVKTINAYLGGDITLHLPDILDDSDYATVVDAQDIIEDDENGNKYFCISNLLLYACGVYSLVPDPDSDGNPVDQDDPNAVFSNRDLLLENMAITERLINETMKFGLSALPSWTTLYESTKDTFKLSIDPVEKATLSFSQADYTRSFNLYKDPKYAGCFISELSAMVTQEEETNKDIYKPRMFASVLDPESYNESTRYYTKKDEAGQPVLDYSFQKVGEGSEATIQWVEGPDNNMELVASGTNPFENPPVGDSVIYTRIEDGDTYTYTPLEGDPESGVTYYVRKSDSYISEEAQEPTSTTAENSAFEVLEDGVNDTYEKSIWEATTYDVALRGSAIDSGKADDEVEALKSAMSSDNVVFYVKDNDKYILIVFPGGTDEANNTQTETSLVEMSSDNRRGLHYVIKQVAALRKDLTCIFTTPYHPEEGEDEGVFDINRACNWVAARGDYTDLFEYGNSQAIDYSEQAFYCEMYWSWVKFRAVKLVNGLATGSATIEIPATGFVILNSLASFRTKGSFYPVAGDQGGILPDSCTILQNPSTKSQRDKLISYRINPIYDTGLRGIQIYGNDTLNPQYTDLSAAHIARTLVQIRSRVDRYSETIKFKLNDKYTWGSWINYVNTRILDPIKAAGGLQWYKASMGYETTSREEIAQRKIRGQISLQFTQALEIVDLEFVVYSSALDMEA